MKYKIHLTNFYFYSPKKHLCVKSVKGLRSCGVGYRFGFNGKENDDEVKGDGSQQDYGMRIYDNRLGRFLTVDPLTQSYPWNSTYAFAENDVIRCIDLDGLEKQWAIDGVTMVDGPYDMSKINSSKVVQANIVKQRAMNSPPPIPKPKVKPQIATEFSAPTTIEPLPWSLGACDDYIHSPKGPGPDAAGGGGGFDYAFTRGGIGVNESSIETEKGNTLYTTVRGGLGKTLGLKVSKGPSVDFYWKTANGENTPASELLKGPSNYLSAGAGIMVNLSWTNNEKGETTMVGVGFTLGLGVSGGKQYTFETINAAKDVLKKAKEVVAPPQ